MGMAGKRWIASHYCPSRVTTSVYAYINCMLMHREDSCSGDAVVGNKGKRRAMEMIKQRESQR